jgi:DNA polymerase-3 subunit chi
LAEIGFYHLTRSRLEDALPRLLEKIRGAGHRVLVRAVTPERLDLLDRQLWEYDRAAFLPHGTSADGFAERQPIFLTTAAENPNRASALVLVEGAEPFAIDSFARLAELFDGRDEDAVARARERWRRFRSAGHELVYWRQDERGRWVAERRVAAGDASAAGEPQL